MQNKIYLLLLVFISSSCALMAQTPNDTRVIENLTKLNFKYDVKDDGTFLFTVPVGSRTQMVFVHSATSQYDQMEIREVFSVIYQSNQRPTETQLAKLLTDNSQKKLGAWEMIVENSQVFLVFTAKIPANQSEKDFRSTIDIVATSSDAMEQLLFSTDNW
jgi:hypothetical protein